MSNGVPNGAWSNIGKPLFNSLVGFALEVGDRLVINGEEVIFKGWIDQSQTSITVQAIADATERKIQAREIKSLGRSVMTESPNPSTDHQSPNAEMPPENHADPLFADTAHGDHDNVDPSPTVAETPDEPVTPTYNAWEVWTYLERQRLKTLKLINTFDAEWEANRFVREAERNTPPNLRIHYEICPIWRDLDSAASDVNQDAQAPSPDDSSSDHDAGEYADAIDVEIIS